MKILIITKHLNLGGIPRHILDLTSQLTSRGISVYIASIGGVLLKDLETAGAKHIFIPLKTKSILSPEIFKSYKILKSYFKKEKLSLIHTHTRTASVLGYWLSKKLHIPQISTVHGIYKNKLNRKLFPFIGRRAIAVSDETAHRLASWLKIPAIKITTIYNGVDCENFSSYLKTKEQAREQLGLPETSFILGNISRLEKIKGQELLIEGLNILKPKIPELKLLLVGEGSYKNDLEAKIAKYGLQSDVIFTSGVRDIRPALRCMDIFCFTPREEPFGLVLLEAMAAEIAIIANSVSQIPQILNNGDCGILISPSDILKFTEAVGMLYYDSKKRELLGEKAKQRAADYSIEKMVEATLGAYKELLKK